MKKIVVIFLSIIFENFIPAKTKIWLNLAKLKFESHLLLNKKQTQRHYVDDIFSFLQLLKSNNILIDFYFIILKQNFMDGKEHVHCKKSQTTFSPLLL